ncbi:hypothetical protein EMIHUDRAFT_247791 [Emiliania huxleyi CCMP1516]|uniref:Uncharacterized protein n=2 Tax=Emiliania huxleyi TaxID=2903 RepID=A0A0D3IKC4_EMIH1|nr:hypothetical protein EMIHUDRAFT_247791 [Emiliania huxleyi CCMP1516]EOD11709.1 hypothetical protein EMIHUDRAFT_247791 [Emiliania huxleyi CCMP1516]|eukprot:XP_005764138.1 hypothetical protein EMIHUDRAFT_247791 [Emiliania huxleyi CCMP1516]
MEPTSLPTSRCYAVKISLWGEHRPARVREGLRWLAELVLPSVTAAAAFHRHTQAGHPSASHDALVLLGGTYSSNRTEAQLDAAALTWPSGAAHAAFRQIERSAPSLPRGDVLLHGAHRVDRITLFSEPGRVGGVVGSGLLHCAWDDGGGSFQLSQGQSVSLEASLWRSLGAPYEVHGHHVHLQKIWRQRVGAANAALLFRVRPPALTGADARQVTVLMGRL